MSMKSIITKPLLLASVLLLVTSQVWADAASDLKQKLAALPLFSATFSQTVYDNQGKHIQQASGNLLIKHPNRFRWQTQQPDESLLVADGKDLWMFDPFVEQVTVLTLQDAVLNTPFGLIAGSDETTWQRYNVARQGDSFVITSRNKSDLIASFSITFDRNNNISHLKVTESQGQRSEFVLTQLDRKPRLKGDEFIFTLPKGVMLDDQRR